MLAYLLQEEPQLIPEWLDSLGIDADGLGGWEVETQRSIPGGFLDLVLFIPGQAIVIVESKLGSTTDFEQISKYISYAKTSSCSLRALVFMTQHPEPWPDGSLEHAGEDVALVLRRWQALSEFLGSRDVVLGSDFIDMLEEEGIVTPTALTREDWQVWQRGNSVSRHLATLLEETGSDLLACAPDPIKTLPVSFSNTGAVNRGFDFQALSLYIGFWPTRKPLKPDEHALINVYVLNKTLPVAERKGAAQAAIEKAATPYVVPSGWSEYHIVKATPAHEVLNGDTFHEQCRQLVEHVKRDLRYFASLGYLGNVWPAIDEVG
jgi:hypothetical protein